MIHRRSVLDQQSTGERSAGTEGKQIIEGFGIVLLDQMNVAAVKVRSGVFRVKPDRFIEVF